jgi:hypothetical protein
MVAPLEAQTRCLIGIGGYSVIVAGAPRAPESFSISLVPFDFDLSGRRRHIFADSRATFALFAVEMTFPGVGRWMCKTFPQQMLQKRSRPFGSKLLVTRAPSIYSVKALGR